MTVFSDDFVGASGQLLSARSGWTKITDGDRYAIINASDQLATHATAGTNSAYICTDQGSADHTTEVGVLEVNTSAANFYCSRMTDLNNFYGVRHNQTQWEFYVFNASTPTLLDSYVDTATAGDIIKIISNGNNFAIQLNSVEIMGATSQTFNNTETRQGIAVRASSIDPFLEYFSAYPNATGGSMPPNRSNPLQGLIQR